VNFLCHLDAIYRRQEKLRKKKEFPALKQAMDYLKRRHELRYVTVNSTPQWLIATTLEKRIKKNLIRIHLNGYMLQLIIFSASPKRLF